LAGPNQANHELCKTDYGAAGLATALAHWGAQKFEFQPPRMTSRW
jgi:hypothetical protein